MFAHPCGAEDGAPYPRRLAHAMPNHPVPGAASVGPRRCTEGAADPAAAAKPKPECRSDLQRSTHIPAGLIICSAGMHLSSTGMCIHW